jgi:uncharacterized protein YyaL (SSP411 family)
MAAEEYTNALIHEKSPYLLQHAHNPVNWYPWGEEAFRKAKAEDKPIFLSIGYSTCHWCHVMAHESFESLEVAEILNRDYVCIKVDREERPDVDAVYMSVCMAFHGSGGWPLTVLMTPEQKPFWVGTYLPKTSQYGHMGLLELLNSISQLWKTDKERLLESGETAVRRLEQIETEKRPASELTVDVFKRALKWFRRTYDPDWGGFGTAPKFPTPFNLLFLLRYSSAERDRNALKMVRHTLDQMYRGGIYDHIGGGFSRYSTDERWLIPHFEKTLYDNALLAQVYLKAYQKTGSSLYRRIAENVLHYVLRELTDEQSGFYCGQDADSEGEEGKYYVFTPHEIETVLGKGKADEFCRWFGITKAGNFEGKSVPNLIANPRYEERNPQIETACKILADYRLKRTVLHKDDKVLTAWNALIISALADAYIQLEEPVYLKAAQDAQQFLSKSLVNHQTGRLYHRWRKGEAGIDAQLDDYAFYASALLKLYQATFRVAYLREAVMCSKQMVDLFFDKENGGFYLYAKDAESLIGRPKETDDGALPSGNSIALAVLLRLFKLTGETEWQTFFQKQVEFYSGYLVDFPTASCAALYALIDVLYPSRELICVTSGEEAPPELLSFLHRNQEQLPFTTVKTKANQKELAELAPYTESYPIPSQGTAYYLCKEGKCSAPVTDLQDLQRLIFES